MIDAMWVQKTHTWNEYASPGLIRVWWRAIDGFIRGADIYAHVRRRRASRKEGWGAY